MLISDNVITKKISILINQGHSRSVKAKKNIIGSLFVKGLSIVISFLIVPMTLNYLDPTRYGIWLAVASILSWFSVFDLGLGNGLRNKLAETFAVIDYENAKIYVSTTYALITIFICVIFGIFIFVNQYIDWTHILSADRNLAEELRKLALVVFGLFFLSFLLKTVGFILLADQRTAFNNLLSPLASLLSLITIFFLTRFTHGSLMYLGITMSIFPVLVFTFTTVYLFSKDYKKISPSLFHVNFKYANALFGLGLKFFLIQISTIVLFQSSNIIISHFFGPVNVTPFDIAYKYFSIIYTLYVIMIAPYWSAFTEAWTKNDIQWIKFTVKKLIRVWYAMAFITVVMLIFAMDFFSLWIGKEGLDKMNISPILLISLSLYFLLITFGGIFNMFINGVGKISLQLISFAIGAILFIPICYILITFFHFNIESVIVASIVANFYLPFVAPIQYYKIINGKAKGIWNK